MVVFGIILIMACCKWFSAYNNRGEEVAVRKKAWDIVYNEEISDIDRAEASDPIVISNTSRSIVRRAKYRGYEVAIKILLTGRDKFEDEMDFMTRVRHPNIVLFFGGGTRIVKRDGVERGRVDRFLVMEYMPLTSLRGVLNEPQVYQMSQDCRLQLAIDIAEAMKFLHGRGAVHRDLKSDNILITRCSKRNGALLAKLADFGEALTVDRGCIRNTWRFVKSCYKSCQCLRNTALQSSESGDETSRLMTNPSGYSLSSTLTDFAGIGTKGYQAPEVIEGRNCTEKIDVYRYEML